MRDGGSNSFTRLTLIYGEREWPGILAYSATALNSKLEQNGKKSFALRRSAHKFAAVFLQSENVFELGGITTFN